MRDKRRLCGAFFCPSHSLVGRTARARSITGSDRTAMRPLRHCMIFIISIKPSANKNWRQMHHTLSKNTAIAMHTQGMGSDQIQIAHSKPA